MRIGAAAMSVVEIGVEIEIEIGIVVEIVVVGVVGGRLDTRTVCAAEQIVAAALAADADLVLFELAS